MLEIRDDDDQFIAWLGQHPNGFVVNAERAPRAGYLVLHKATCPWISKTSQSAGAWTHRCYIKICSEQISELESWARRETGGTLTACRKCNPA